MTNDRRRSASGCGGPGADARLAPGRRGLSTLEMVLALPILLFVMALIVNAGTMAAWKVRGLGASRNILWSTRAPRSGGSMPRPGEWPPSAGLGVSGSSHVAELDDPRIHLPIARGPLPYGCTVNADLLDITRGLRTGTSHLVRKYPLLQRMPAYSQEAKDRLLGDKWQFGEMGLGWNNARRIPLIYSLPKADPAFVQAYVAAAVGIYFSPRRSDLAPLDRDPDFIRWRGAAPDFHPRLASFCSLDHGDVEDRVNQLIDRIKGNGDDQSPVDSVARRMAASFRGLYDWVANLLRQTHGDPALIAQMEHNRDLCDNFWNSLGRGG